MSIATLILGESGTGKSASMRNLNPEDVLLIQVIKKPLPFRSGDWKRYDPENKKNPFSIWVTDSPAEVSGLMKKTSKPIIIIDDFQYLMANEFMRRAQESGWQKFVDIGQNAWCIFKDTSELPDNKRVYILSHTQTDEHGSKMKTIGKMLDEKITMEGMLTIVLKTHVMDGEYRFITQNSGNDTVKSPMGMFEDKFIDNDLNEVDLKICDYYGIERV